jgi:hypothetical protein
MGEKGGGLYEEKGGGGFEEKGGEAKDFGFEEPMGEKGGESGFGGWDEAPATEQAAKGDDVVIN